VISVCIVRFLKAWKTCSQKKIDLRSIVKASWSKCFKKWQQKSVIVNREQFSTKTGLNLTVKGLPTIYELNCEK